MAKYRLKPIEFEALQWTGTNLTEIRAFINFAKIFCNGNEPKVLLIAIDGEETVYWTVNLNDWIVLLGSDNFEIVQSNSFTEKYESA